MKTQLRMRTADDVWFLWLLAAALFVGGWVFVQARYEGAIRASADRSESLYRQTLADRRVAADAARLRRLERRAEIDLARVSRDGSLSESTADLLSTLHASAPAFDTSVIALQPQAGIASAGALRSTPLTIHVQGRFRHVLRFVEHLSQHTPLLGVTDTELAIATGTNAGEAEPRLDATIHATMYRLQMNEREEQTNAAAR